MYSMKGNTLLLGQYLPSPWECMPQLCFFESCALPEPHNLSSTRCLPKTCDSPPHSHSPWSREVFFLCEPGMHSLHPSLFFSFFSLPVERPTSPPRHHHCSLPQFTSCILHLPHCLPPNVEILLPVLRSISWVFHMIWLQYSCVLGMRQTQDPPISPPS